MDLSSLFTLPSFWFDIICMVIFIIMCARYVHLGFLAAVVQIFGTMFSLVGAHFVAAFADSIVYEKFLESALRAKVESVVLESSAQGLESLTDSMSGAIDGMSGTISESMLDSIPEMILPELPDTFWAMLQESGMTTTSIDLSGTTSAIVQSLMENVISLIALQTIYVVLFTLSFVAIRMLVFLLVQALKSANGIPVLGGVNRTLGWVIGLAGACVDIFLLLCVVWFVVIFSENALPVVNATDLSTSVFYILFQQFNPFV
ncbi:MAG: hypothetical protein R3Y06_11135 [Faecalibacterium sp.]